MIKLGERADLACPVPSRPIPPHSLDTDLLQRGSPKPVGEAGAAAERGSATCPVAAEADPVRGAEQQVQGSDGSPVAPETRHPKWVIPCGSAGLTGELAGARRKCSPSPD